jgi:hypothetical protein
MFDTAESPNMPMQVKGKEKRKEGGKRKQDRRDIESLAGWLFDQFRSFVGGLGGYLVWKQNHGGMVVVICWVVELSGCARAPAPQG